MRSTGDEAVLLRPEMAYCSVNMRDIGSNSRLPTYSFGWLATVTHTHLAIPLVTLAGAGSANRFSITRNRRKKLQCHFFSLGRYPNLAAAYIYLHTAWVTTV